MKRALVLCFLASFAAGMLVSVSPPAIGFKEIAAGYLLSVAEMQELKHTVGVLIDQNKVLRGQLEEANDRFKSLENQCV